MSGWADIVGSIASSTAKKVSSSRSSAGKKAGQVVGSVGIDAIGPVILAEHAKASKAKESVAKSVNRASARGSYSSSGGSGGGGGGGSSSSGGSSKGSSGYNSDLAQLASLLQNFNVKRPSDKDLQEEAFRSVALQYDPQIRAIAQEMQDANIRGQSSIKSLGDIYGSLAKYTKGRIKPSKQDTQIAKNQAANRAASAKSEIMRDYQSRLAEQVNMYKQLGIQAAAATTVPDQTSDQAGYLAQVAALNAAEQGALNIEGQADTDFYRKGAVNARQEGAEATGAVQSQLNSYLNKLGSEKLGLSRDKTSASSAAFLKLRNEANQSYQAAQESMWDKLMALTKFKTDLSNTSFDRDVTNQKLKLEEQRNQISAAKAQSSANKEAKGKNKGLGAVQRELGQWTGTWEKLYQNARQYAGSKQVAEWYNMGQPGYKPDPQDYAQWVYWAAKRNGYSEQSAKQYRDATLLYYGKT